VGENYLLVMELMKGATADTLRDQGVFDEPTVLRVLLHIARALGYAESQRLVHRDVKPDNILFNEEGAYKLADLGIAAPISENGVATQERIFGSPHYVAPEQARGGAIDVRADLYALGATAFHLLTGKTLYTGTNRQVVVAHISTPPPDLGKLVPQLSDELVDLVMELLEKDPEDRPENANEVAERVDALLKNPPKPRGPAGHKRMPRVRRRRRYRSS
jgi:serine/threonine-protein kinase